MTHATVKLQSFPENRALNLNSRNITSENAATATAMLNDLTQRTKRQ